MERSLVRSGPVQREGQDTCAGVVPPRVAEALAVPDDVRPAAAGRGAAGRGTAGGAGWDGASGARSARARSAACRGWPRAGASRTRTARCPGNRRCCCRAACAAPRRRPGSWGRPGSASGRPRSSWPGAGGAPHLGVVGLSLHPAVPGEVVAGAVAVVLAVGFVVLAVVGDEIGEREAVVAGDEVDAAAGERWSSAKRSLDCRPGASPLRRSAPARRARTGASRRGSGRSTPPSACRGRRRRGRGPAASQASAMSGRSTRTRESSMLQGRGGSARTAAVFAAREDAGQVEAEAVHAHLVRPVLEAVHDEAGHQRVVAAHGVAAARVVAVAAVAASRW